MAASMLKSAFPPLYNAIMSLYRHLPLLNSPPSIRLLELDLDSDETSKIYSKMDTYKIQLQPDYDALSYTWGTDPDLVNTATIF